MTATRADRAGTTALALVAGLAALPPLARAQAPCAERATAASRLADVVRDGLACRDLGPFRAGSWITDVGVYVSLDAGARRLPLGGNMPAVPVHDLVVHPRDGDLAVGTDGPGVWVADATLLRELGDAVLAADAHRFSPGVRARRAEGAVGNYHLFGDRHLFTRNDPSGVTVTYHLRAAAAARTRVTAADSAGRTVRTLEGPSTAGIDRVVCDLADAERRSRTAGTYAVTLEAGGRRRTRPAVVR